MFKAKEEDIDKIRKLISICNNDTLDIYTTYGFIEEAKKDRDSEVRRMAYDIFGWDETAKQDDDDYNREMAYRLLGFEDENDILDDETSEDILLLYYSKYPSSMRLKKLKTSSLVNRIIYLLDKTQEELHKENVDSYWVREYFNKKEMYDIIIKMLESENLSDVLFQMKNTDRNIQNMVKIKMYDHLVNGNRK